MSQQTMQELAMHSVNHIALVAVTAVVIAGAAYYRFHLQESSSDVTFLAAPYEHTFFVVQ
jgi:hypothetical protein